MLKKEISNSRKLGDVKTDRARVLWFMMLPHLDAVGRLEADTKRIKGQITTMLPYNEKAIQGCLEQLHDVGLLTLYVIDDNQYLEYTRYNDFQVLNPDREANSKIPAPTPDNSRELKTPKSNISKVKLNLNEDKDKYLDFVFLSKDEHRKLVEEFGIKGTEKRIKNLNIGIGSKGYRYDSHYFTILSWDRKDERDSSKPPAPKLMDTEASPEWLAAHKAATQKVGKNG